jgi:hypothetical protein
MSFPTTTFEDYTTDNNPPWTSVVDGDSFVASVAAQSSRVSYENAGLSYNGLPLYLIRVGYPSAPTDQELREKAVTFHIAEQHGNEPCGRDALFSYLRDLAFSTDPAVQAYLSEHPILMVPTANPDNMDIIRGNGSGADINRTWDRLNAPESRVLSDIIGKFSPVIVTDWHNLGGSADDYYTFYCSTPSVAPEISALSIELKQAADASVISEGFTAVDFSGGDTLDLARNAIGLTNAVTLLVEPAQNGDRKNEVRGAIIMLRGIEAWHSANAARILSGVATAKLSAITEGAAGTAIIDPPTPEGIIGYEASADQITSSGAKLALRNISYYPIYNSTEFYIPAAQASRRVIALAMLDLYQGGGGSRVTVAPRVEAQPNVYNLRLVEPGTGTLADFKPALPAADLTLYNLAPYTQYDLSIQTQEAGNFSDWSATTSFDTTIAYNLEWRDTATQTTTLVTGITDLFYDLSGLTPATDYEFRVKEVAGGNESAFSSWTTVTTTSAAAIPQGIWTIGSITKDQSSANLTPVYSGSDATSFEYTLNGTSWTTFTSSISLTGLTANTQYPDAAVRAVNAVGNGASKSFAFQTDAPDVTSLQMQLTGIPNGNHETVVLNTSTQTVLYWGTAVWSGGAGSLEIAAASGTNVHYYAIGATKGGLQRGTIL